MSDIKKGKKKKHSEESKQIMSDTKKGEKNPMFGQNHTEKTKQKISDAIKGYNHSDETRQIMSDAKKGKPRPEGARRPSQQIEVTDIKNNTTTSYDSIHEATIALNISNHKAISNYFKQNQQKPYKGQYTFKKI